MPMNLCRLVLLVCLMLFPVVAGADDGKNVAIRVSANDTLIGLCQRYLDQPEKWPLVSRLNRLSNPHRLAPGQTLLIPVELLKGIPMQGVVTFLKGNAYSRQGVNAPWKPLQLKDNVREGSSLKTADSSVLEVGFDDGTAFLLRENTSVTIKTAKKGAFHLLRVLYLETGKVVSRVKSATGRGSRFEIETPSALAAARGTHYRVSVDGQNTTRAEMLESAIDLSAMGSTVALHEGEGSLAKLHEPPMAPVALLLPPEQIPVVPSADEPPSAFRFSRIEKAIAYRVALTRDPEGNDAVKAAVIPPDATFAVEGIADGRYYLMVSSIDALGLEGPLSKPHAFSVRVRPLPPELLSLTDTTITSGSPFALRWQGVAGVAAYHLQIAADSAFTKPVVDQDAIRGTTYQVQSLQAASYYVRMRSMTDSHEAGPWTAASRFTVESLPAPEVESARHYYYEALGVAGIVLMLVLL